LCPPEKLKQKLKPISLLTRALASFAILGFYAAALVPAQSHEPSSNSQSELKPKAKANSKSSETRKLAQFHTTRREFKEAIGLWSRLADQKPDAFAEANLGWSYLQLGEKTKAKKHISRSIELNPRTIEGHRYLGYYLMGEGKVPEAVKAFRTSMSFDPHHKCNCGDLEKLVLSKSPKRKP
jgi:tetratricopeptide (TPR) repeat protein